MSGNVYAHPDQSIGSHISLIFLTSQKWPVMAALVLVVLDVITTTIGLQAGGWEMNGAMSGIVAVPAAHLVLKVMIVFMLARIICYTEVGGWVKASWVPVIYLPLLVEYAGTVIWNSYVLMHIL